MTDVYFAHYDIDDLPELIGVYSSFELATQAINAVWEETSGVDGPVGPISVEVGWKVGGPNVWAATLRPGRDYYVERITLDAPLGS